MKSLKKKICVSVFLDELFEEVESESGSYASRSSHIVSTTTTTTTATGNNCSSILSGEVDCVRDRRPRRYRNAWRLSRRENAVFRNQFEELRHRELWTRPVVERADRGTDANTEEDEEEEEEDDDVDGYEPREEVEAAAAAALGDGVRGGRDDAALVVEKIKRDVALSAISITLSMKDDEGQILLQEETEETREVVLVEAPSNVNRSLYSIPEMVKSKRRVSKALQTEEEEQQQQQQEEEEEEERAEGGGGSKHCFVVARCAKSMDLTRKNNKSTQFDVATCVDAAQAACAKRRQSSEGKIGDRGRKMEEIYHHANGSKSRRSVAKRKGSLIGSRTSSESKVRQPRDNLRLWHNVRHSKTWCSAVESESADYKILKKGYCDVTVKTFMKTNAEHFLCYSLSIPWEMTVFGEIIIPQTTVRSMKSHHDEKIFDDSLNLFRKAATEASVLDEPRLGTQCRVGMSPEATKSEESPSREKLPPVQEQQQTPSPQTTSADDVIVTRTRSLLTQAAAAAAPVADEPEAPLALDRTRSLLTATQLPVDESHAQTAENEAEIPGRPHEEEVAAAAAAVAKDCSAAEEEAEAPRLGRGRSSKKVGAVSRVEVKVSETASSVSTEVSGFELVPAATNGNEDTVVQIVACGEKEAKEAAAESTALVLHPYIVDKCVNTEPVPREEDDVVVQWELEIEIHNNNNNNNSSNINSCSSSNNNELVVSKSSRDEVSSQSSKAQIIRAVEGPSETNVILVYDSSYGNVSDGNVSRAIEDVEQCYLRDDRMRKMYLANVPRRVLDITEEKLRGKGSGGGGGGGK